MGIACLTSPAYGAFFDDAKAWIRACGTYLQSPETAQFPNVSCYYDFHQHAGQIESYASLTKLNMDSSVLNGLADMISPGLKSHDKQLVQCVAGYLRDLNPRPGRDKDPSPATRDRIGALMNKGPTCIQAGTAHPGDVLFCAVAETYCTE